MEKAALVIVFEEPDTFEAIVEAVEFIFSEKANIKVYATINETAQQVISIVETSL